jgi:hypothetical protein
MTEKTKIDDGGQAFPHSSQPLDLQGNPMLEEHSEWGMSLRDYFAGKALQSYLAGRNSDQRDSDADWVARTCYKYADAMIQARKK